MNEYMNTISAIAAAIAAVASMVTVIISVVQQHQMKKHDDLKTESEQILLWYNKVVLEDLMKRLNQTIDNIENDIIICRKHRNPSVEQELKEVFDNIKKQFMIVQNEMYILKMFDNTLHRNCNKKLQEILDFYSNFINESVEKKKFVYHNSHNIQQYRIELISMMYNEGLKQIAKWN